MNENEQKQVIDAMAANHTKAQAAVEQRISEMFPETPNALEEAAAVIQFEFSPGPYRRIGQTDN